MIVLANRVSSMPADTSNLILEHLRAIRSDLHEVREEQREQRIRLGAIERTTAEMSLRLDRMHDRLDRIERRLDLVEV
jgi:hypothetical protein